MNNSFTKKTFTVLAVHCLRSIAYCEKKEKSGATVRPLFVKTVKCIAQKWIFQFWQSYNILLPTKYK